MTGFAVFGDGSVFLGHETKSLLGGEGPGRAELRCSLRGGLTQHFPQKWTPVFRRKCDQRIIGAL